MHILGTMKGAVARSGLILLCMVPGSGLALDFSCVFDIECFETDACETTAYGMDLTIDETEVPFLVTAMTDAETMSGEAYPFGDGLLMRLGSEVGAVLISVDSAGFARQSVHMSGEALMINYLGACEGGF